MDLFFPDMTYSLKSSLMSPLNTFAPPCPRLEAKHTVLSFYVYLSALLTRLILSSLTAETVLSLSVYANLAQSLTHSQGSGIVLFKIMNK